MYQCPNCGKNVNPGARFCAACAFDLSQPYPTVPVQNDGPVAPARACQRCGTVVAPNAQFCPACASPVSAGFNNTAYGGAYRAQNRTPLIIGAIALGVVLIAGVVTLILLLTGKDSPPSSNTSQGGTIAGASPTKERAVQVLRDFLAAINAGDRDRAVSMVILPPDMTVDRAKEQMRDASRVDLSSKGIDIIAQNGVWGKASDLYDQAKLKTIVEKSKLPIDNFYALKHRNAFALFYWDGKQFKLIDINDIDQLEKSV